MPSHTSRQTLEAEQRRLEMAELVAGVLEHAFESEGPEGGMELLREALQKLGAPALTELVFAVGAETEPVKEEEVGRRSKA